MCLLSKYWVECLLLSPVASARYICPMQPVMWKRKLCKKSDTGSKSLIEDKSNGQKMFAFFDTNILLILIITQGCNQVTWPKIP